MIYQIEIQTIQKSDYNYSIIYKSNNYFFITLSPKISLPQRLKLTVKFRIISSLINDNSFYLSDNQVSIKLKIYHKLSQT